LTQKLFNVLLQHRSFYTNLAVAMFVSKTVTAG